MAIFFALQSPELDVIGLTTTYGNVRTTMATANALHLVTDLSSLPEYVCEGEYFEHSLLTPEKACKWQIYVWFQPSSNGFVFEGAEVVLYITRSLGE